ncbi:hypothetical protein [Pseudidiomarina taiwanensis]|uniref:DUF2059 domain-containing protein n=1 Tax=Pseudidiomarina taiwanensis TaxID=337250 RepID=A0A432ZC64_9GAMM|nr:hypothetical protein [Pseudidiomarina taiwanensis]RUO75499.1 hypothetical protein CWI83_10235 [Pseudidiomarina taiwanensis]
MKKLPLAMLLGVSFGLVLPNSTVHATSFFDSSEANYSVETYQPSSDTVRLMQTYKRMLRYYEQRNFSPTRSVRVLLSNYPEHVEAILLAALDRYPKQYRQTLKAAIDAEPGFTRDIIIVALSQNIGDPAEIVRIAVEAEPSYADAIVQTAGERYPDSIETIVKVAVTVEPQMADSIMRSASEQQPGKLEAIVTASLEAVPAFGSYLASTLIDLIGLSEEADLEAQYTPRERAMQVLRGAHRAGVDTQQLQVVADNYGISHDELVDIIEN